MISLDLRSFFFFSASFPDKGDAKRSKFGRRSGHSSWQRNRICSRILRQHVVHETSKNINYQKSWLNLALINIPLQEGPILFHSAEVGPAENNESQLSILTISPGESHVRCNKYTTISNDVQSNSYHKLFTSIRYLRLKINEDHNGLAVLSSNGRHHVMETLGLPTNIGEVVDMLSNDDDQDYPIYRRGTEKDIVLTIATGIFDFNRREWRLYVDNAKNSRPIATFSMNL